MTTTASSPSCCWTRSPSWTARSPSWAPAPPSWPRRCPQPGASTRTGPPAPTPATGPDAPVLHAVARLAEIPGISEDLARAIIAETGLDMTRFPTAAHLVSWAGLCPSARQSGPRTRAGKKGQGDTWLRGSLGQAAIGAARTATFLGERYSPDRPPPRQGQGPGRRRPLHPGHHLAPAQGPRGPVHRPRLRLLPGPHRYRPQAPQPHPPDPGPRLRGHPHQEPP